MPFCTIFALQKWQQLQTPQIGLSNPVHYSKGLGRYISVLYMRKEQVI